MAAVNKKYISILNGVLFIIVWTVIFYLGSDKPVPEGFWLMVLGIIVLGIAQSIVLHFFLLNYSRWIYYVLTHGLALVIVGACFFDYMDHPIVVLGLFIIGAIFGIYEKILVVLLQKWLVVLLLKQKDEKNK